MPVVHLIEVVRRTPPRSAIALLQGIPADRLALVMAELPLTQTARLLLAAPSGFRETLIDILGPDQLIAVLQKTSHDDTIRLLLLLPGERLGEVANSLDDATVVELLANLPGARQAAILAAMDPGKAYVASARLYESQVAETLTRINADVSVPTAVPSGTFMVQGLRWRILVAARYGDNGTIAVREAEECAFRIRATGALGVVNLSVAGDVFDYCGEAQEQGRPVAVVTWADKRHDGILKKTLVSLFQ